MGTAGRSSWGRQDGADGDGRTERRGAAGEGGGGRRDGRRCPGLTVARRAQHYPIFGLGVQLRADEIDSGGSLVGHIANGAGHYNTLLLVDDNGVVQDLRRFLIVQGGEVAFDIPMARVGATRDTSQLLIAIATPGRIESVTANAGRLASDFFPALIAELDDSALIGLGSVYVR